MTTSKVILLVSYIFGAILTALTVIGTVMGYDVTPLSIITGAVFGEISVANGFYYNKAKKENVIKIAVGLAKDVPTEKVEDIVNLVNSIGGVL